MQKFIFIQIVCRLLNVLETGIYAHMGTIRQIIDAIDGKLYAKSQMKYVTGAALIQDDIITLRRLRGVGYAIFLFIMLSLLGLLLEISLSSLINHVFKHRNGRLRYFNA